MAKYIDVEPLINDGWQLQRWNSGDGYVNQEHAALKDIPPADVRPVVRGEWEHDNWGFDYDRCSVCGYEHRWPGPFYFCPNCGADMRGYECE